MGFQLEIGGYRVVFWCVHWTGNSGESSDEARKKDILKHFSWGITMSLTAFVPDVLHEMSKVCAELI